MFNEHDLRSVHFSSVHTTTEPAPIFHSISIASTHSLLCHVESESFVAIPKGVGLHRRY
jgi:hypothetical protein